MIAAGANYLKFEITGDSSQLKKELEAAKRGIQDVGNAGASSNMRSVAGQMDAMAMSAKQLTAATRGLPAQFTDIFVSLQGGQAPLTVLLQQGGQLKDMFGGIGPAAKAMGGYILGLVNPYSLAAAGVLALGAAYYQGSQEADAWRKAIVTSGNAVGVTQSQLRAYAQQLDGVVGTQHAAAMGLAEMVQAGVAGGQQLRDYTRAAIAWESATGQAVSETAKQFKDLAKDPLQAVLKLNEGTNFLTLDLYEQIKALDEQGRSTEAASLAQEAYASTLNERSAQIKQNLGWIERAWSGIAGAAKQAWDAMLNIGRPATLEDQLAEVEKQLEVALANQSWGETGGGAATGRVTTAYQKQVQEEIKVLKEKRWALMDQIDAQHLSAVASSENAKAVAAQEAWRSVTAANLTKEAKLTRELTAVREAGIAAGKSEQEIETELALVRERYAEKTKKASTATKTAYESLIVSINEKRAAVDKELAQGEKLTESEKLRERYQQDLITRGREYSAAQRARIEQDLAALEAQEKQVIAARALAKAWEEDAKALEQLQRKREQSVARLRANVDKIRLEEEAHGLAAAMGITHAEAIERLTIARLEEQLAMAHQGAESQATIDWLEQELAVRRQLQGLVAQRGVREANEKAQKELVKSWEQVSQTVGRTLADYIMGGGKDAATYLKRLFSTLVLQPVVQTLVGGVMGSGSGQSGVNAGSSDLLGTASNIYKMFTSPSSMFQDFGGWLGNSINNMGGKAFNAGLESVGSSLMDFGDTVSGLSDAINVAGDVLGYGKAIYDLTQGKYGSAVGTAIGTAVGGPVGAMIGSTLGGLVDGMFGSNPHDHRGGVYSNATSDRNAVLKGLGLTRGPERSDFTSRGNAAVSTALGTTIDELLGAYDTLAERATGAARDLSVYAGFATNPKDKGQLAYGYLRIFDAATQELLYKAQHRNSSDALGSDPAQAFSNFTGEIAGVLVQQLKAADLPGWMRGIFDGMGETVTLESFGAAMQQIQAIDYQIDMLGKTMTMFVGISDSMKTSLLGGLGGIEGLTATAQGFYQSYYSEQERYEASLKQMRDTLAALDLSIDPALGERAKAEYRAAVEAAMDAGQGELAAQMLAISGSFAQVADYAAKSAQAAADAARDAATAVLDRAQSQADAAMRQLEFSIGRERDYWSAIASKASEAVASLSNAVDMLQSNAQSLYGTVNATAQQQAVQGMLYVEDALAAVKQGASLLSFDRLQDSIAAARSGISSGNYASALDRDYDALALAGQLSVLSELGDLQLTAEERLLKAAQREVEQLDQTLAYWRDALAMDQQQIDATMSVASAVYYLDGAIRELASAQAAARAAAAATDWSGAIYTATYQDPTDQAALYNEMMSSGMSDLDIRNAVYQATGNWQTESDWAHLQYLAGLPKFADGGLHAGGLRIVGERGWEVEATGPARIWNQKQLAQALGSGSDTARLEQLVVLLTNEVSRLNDQVNTLKADSRKSREVLEGAARGQLKLSMEAA